MIEKLEKIGGRRLYVKNGAPDLKPMDQSFLKRLSEAIDANFSDSSFGAKELAKIMEVLREEEGYIWLKSLEDTYIHSFIDEMKLTDEVEAANAAHKKEKGEAVAS